MKNKFIMATLFSVFLLCSSNVQAANFTDNQTVDSNKTWTIKFTSDVGFDDLTKQGINVTDSKGNTVSGVGLQLGQDSKTVIVTAPAGGYTVGESYILNVGTKAHSNKSKALKNEYKVHFTIKKDSNANSIVTFKDANLEQAVRTAINKPTGDILKSDVEKITDLSASYRSITDITGIENLTNLQTLYLVNNQISDISNLKGLINLEILDLTNNKISDVSPLRGLINLQELYLSMNQISDVGPLKELINLQTLALVLNQISDVSALSELTNLQYLALCNNKISNIDSLKRFTNLKQLQLHNYVSFDFDWGDPGILEYMKSHDVYTNQISNSDKQALTNALPNFEIWY